jgi:DUF1680 family protein
MMYLEPSFQGVKISDPLLIEKQSANRRYLLSLESGALLFNHQFEAILLGPLGVETANIRIHHGWEDPTCQIRGHFLGSWLSAAAMQWASTGDSELRGKADGIVAELGKYQKANGGEWAASIPEKYLYRIAQHGAAGAPQWPIWKTFMGLIDMFRYGGSEEALGIAENFAKWFVRWTAQFSRDEMDDILDVETGGMLEIWAQLYGITKKDEYRTLMDKYRRGRLFDPLLAGEDVISNMHANTTIPEALGAAAVYEVTGEEEWLDIAKAYWRQTVTERGAYATGSQNSGEIWTPKMKLAARLGDTTQEHCSVYNMMRLADFLFRVTGKKEYADYWEQNLYNGVFAQAYWHAHVPAGGQKVKHDHGLLTYFLPLRAGSRKVWSSEKDDFYCCHGTVVQANAALNRGIYYVSEGSAAVCQFFNSEADLIINNSPVHIKQTIDTLAGPHIQALKKSPVGFPDSHPDTLKINFDIDSKKAAAFDIKIRIPFWLKSNPEVWVNGKREDCNNNDGWISVGKKWEKDSISVVFKRCLHSWPLPDRKNTAAFLYGPVVLAGLCKDEVKLKGDPQRCEEFIVHDNEREWGAWKYSFKTTGQNKNIRFIPLYEIGYEPYTVYFPVAVPVEKA